MAGSLPNSLAVQQPFKTLPPHNYPYVHVPLDYYIVQNTCIYD